jgi:hypothetical protein
MNMVIAEYSENRRWEGADTASEIVEFIIFGSHDAGIGRQRSFDFVGSVCCENVKVNCLFDHVAPLPGI